LTQETYERTSFKENEIFLVKKVTYLKKIWSAVDNVSLKFVKFVSLKFIKGSIKCLLYWI
jgi:hypothetical protein